MAHEIGHNFGAVHDGEGNNDCTKPWTKGIMGPRASSCYKFGNFSECSLKTMTEKLDVILMDTQSRFWDKKRSLLLDWLYQFKDWTLDQLSHLRIFSNYRMIEEARRRNCLTLADEFSSEIINYDIVTHKVLPTIFPNPC